jgi:hypothetical protein
VNHNYITVEATRRGAARRHCLSSRQELGSQYLNPHF